MLDHIISYLFDMSIPRAVLMVFSVKVEFSICRNHSPRNWKAL